MSTMGLTKWNTETTTKFLSLYRDQECLWRNDLQEYRNKNARDTALKSIIAAMKLPGLTVDGVKKKIKYLRSTYMVEVNKVEKSIQSGSGTYKPCLSWFYEMDSFIKYVQSKRNTQSLLLPNDMENYMQYKIMGSVRHIRMKRGCMPSRFECHSNRRGSLLSHTSTGSLVLKRQQAKLTKEAESSVQILKKSIVPKQTYIDFFEGNKQTDQSGLQNTSDKSDISGIKGNVPVLSSKQHKGNQKQSKTIHKKSKRIQISQPISENEDTQEGINEKQLIELGSLDLHTEIFIKQEDEEQWNYDELAGQSDECIEAPTFDASREQLTSRCSKRNIENHIKQEDQEQWNDDKQAGQSDESIKATTVDTSKEQLTPRGSKRTHMNQLTSIVNDIKSISKENKEKEQNELDVFGKYVGLQLKSLQEEDAILAQEEIMSILTRYKLKKVRRRSISP